MTLDAVQFRTDFPEFADTTLYPDPTVNYYIAEAGLMLNPGRWGTMLTNATELYVAHFLTIRGAALQEAATGAVPGQSRGPIQSERVDKVGASYTADGFEVGAGQWNLSVYGTRLYRLIGIFGAGGGQV